jgi:hypothetical protein
VAYDFPETKGVDSYKDITPRMGAAWDVFGNGRTAVKMNFGRYLEGVGVQLTYANSNPTLRVPTSTGPFGVQGVSRTWIDADADLVPDCDFANPLAHGNPAAVNGGGGLDFCGQLSNTRFGQPVLTGNYDPDLLSGMGVRAADWSFGVSAQQQLMARMSVEVGYYRRWFNGFTLNDNLALQKSDLTPYSITAPSDPRLPNGGGYRIDGLYDVVPARSGQVDNLATLASKYGDWYQYFNGFDVTLNLRTASGITFQGGTSTGQNVADNCDVRANLPELSVGIGAGLVGSNVSTTSPYCHVAYGWLTQLRGLGSYLIPKIETQVSAVFQSKPGALLSANYLMPAVRTATTPANVAVVADFLGRAPSGNVPNVSINLIEPGSLYGDRINQLDFRVAKILRFGGTRSTLSLDLYNVANASAVLTYNQTFVPNGNWLQANSVLTGRLARISAEFTW